jgi:hypothetical protein
VGYKEDFPDIFLAKKAKNTHLKNRLNKKQVKSLPQNPQSWPALSQSEATFDLCFG